MLKIRENYADETDYEIGMMVFLQGPGRERTVLGICRHAETDNPGITNRQKEMARMSIRLLTIAFIAIVAWPVSSNAKSEAQRPLLKGKWAGPSRSHIPGPGPRPGQNLADYFEHLPTGPRIPARAHILVLGGGNGFHHDSISPAMAAIYDWGNQSGLWDAELRTDFDLINSNGGGPRNAGFQPRGLGDFDAVVIASAEGEWPLSQEQKAALLSFVRDKGKGLVVIHAGLAANRNWPDYIDMTGAEQTGHPFNSLDKVLRPFTIIKEDPESPIVAGLPRLFIKQDEIYVVRNWSRDDINVLLRLDERQLDFTGIEDQVPPDHDIPIAWTKFFGKGRVFSTSLGHSRESFFDPDIAKIFTEAIKWTLRLTDGGLKPHPRIDNDSRKEIPD